MDFGRTLFGHVGGTLFAVMVAVSCFGALNGTTFSYNLRVTYLPT